MLKHGMLVSIQNVYYLVIELNEHNICDYVDNPAKIDFGFYGLSDAKEHNDGNIYNIGNYKVCYTLLTDSISIDIKDMIVIQEIFDGNINDIR